MPHSERPMIFNSEMVRAILDGRKTQTRRVIKPQPKFKYHKVCNKEVWCWKQYVWGKDGLSPNVLSIGSNCPYGKVGDVLWVKEKYRVASLVSSNCDGTTTFDIQFADDSYKRVSEIEPSSKPAGRWYSSIFMPKWATRIWLEITGIRVERVQDISEKDAKAEGIKPYPNDIPITVQGIGAGCEGYIAEVGKLTKHKLAFCELWDSINAKRGFGWDKNPWVWVIEFKRIEE